ncbi:MAG: substrate-binding domain-containing protein [Alicyclobacillus sp.]|nr:substrate-binding domain-containing protein [Alicyclobacillus sp.]
MSMNAKAWKIGVTVLSTAVLATTLFGCGGRLQTDSSVQSYAKTVKDYKPIKVALIPKAIGIPYFTGADQGAQLVTKSLNIHLTYNGPTTLSASDQVSMINSYAAQGYDVIAVSANDPTSLAPALRSAMAKGIKVVSWDSDVLPSARDFFVNQATSDGIGTTLVKLVSTHFKGQVDVGILSSTPTNTNQNQWIDSMKKAIAKKYHNVHIVTIQYDEGQPSTGLTAAENIIKGYPNVKAIISPDSVGLPAAAEAVEKLGKKGKIYVTGLADPIVMKKYVKDGTVQQFVLWDVTKLGELTMYVCRAAADGTMPKNGVFKAGNIGTFSVKDGVVLLGPPKIFNKTNINSANY